MDSNSSVKSCGHPCVLLLLYSVCLCFDWELLVVKPPVGPLVPIVGNIGFSMVLSSHPPHPTHTQAPALFFEPSISLSLGMLSNIVPSSFLKRHEKITSHSYCARFCQSVSCEADCVLGVQKPAVLEADEYNPGAYCYGRPMPLPRGWRGEGKGKKGMGKGK